MVVLSMSFISSAQSAVTLGLWNFNDDSEVNFLNTAAAAGPYSGSSYSSSAPSIAHLTVSNLSVGSGLTGSSSGAISGTGTATPPAFNGVKGVGGSNVYVFPRSVAATASAAAAMTAADYFSFTLTPDAAYPLSLTEMSFYGWANQTSTSGTYSYFVQSSLTGDTVLDTFTRTIGVSPGASVQNNTEPSAANNLFTVDLSGHSELTNVTGPVTFFIGVYGNANGSLRLDDLQILGSIVPEPGRSMLLGMAFAGCLLHRRRTALRTKKQQNFRINDEKCRHFK